MGGCCTRSTNIISDEIEYPEMVTIKIKEKDSKNKTIRLDSVDFKVTGAVSQINQSYTFSNFSFSLSTCILPGQDPRLLAHKDCQDGLLCVEYKDTIFLALFDGHGKDGLQVKNFCCSYMKENFVSNYPDFLRDPQAAIESIIINCDKKLRSIPNEIDATLSGTTAVVVYITSEGLHVGSVGDSRAILGTIPNSNTPVEEPPRSTNPFVRVISPSRQLKAIALTVDQKPNHDVECKRIKECGGMVQQLTDDFGNKAGPYRVWQKNGMIPGLAMSRSIGDGVGKEIGVIACPIYNFFEHAVFRDQFLVMASDGV